MLPTPVFVAVLLLVVAGWVVGTLWILERSRQEQMDDLDVE